MTVSQSSQSSSRTKMINSKALLFSCAVLVILWSGTNADFGPAVKAQYPDYHGDVILDADPRHPNARCKEFLKSGLAFWENRNCGKIVCKLPGPYGGYEMDIKVPEGSVYTIGGGYVERQYKICIDGKFLPLRDVWSYE